MTRTGINAEFPPTLPEAEFPPTLPECFEMSGDSKRTIGLIEADALHGAAWAEVHERARQMAALLSRRDVGRGATVALLGATSLDLITALRASWLTGAAVTVLPVPMRMRSLDAFIRASIQRIRHVGASAVLLDPLAASVLGDAAREVAPVWTLDDLSIGASGIPTDQFSLPAVSPDDTAILQFTSGSTDEPKAVELSHRMIIANLMAIWDGARLHLDADSGVSWLPLYHDMGLIGFLLLHMVVGARGYFADPTTFIGSPGRWLDWMTEFRPTVVGAPNFAYALAARLLEAGRGRYDLSSIRVAFNGAEPINPETVQRFSSAAAHHAFDPRAIHCVYGMAEATLAVTFPELREGLTTDTVDADVLETDGTALPVVGGQRRELVRLGRPVTGMETRIVDPVSERVVSERRVGEIRIRGTSVMERYHDQPLATADAFDAEGWLRTGDLGYWAAGELVVCGRLKDIIIVGGRNIYPEELERVVEVVPGVRPGNVAAFSLAPLDGTESFVVAAEVRTRYVGLADAIVEAVRDAVGLKPHDILLLDAGTLPKTSSGKVQRSLCRDLYRRGELQGTAK